MLFVVLAIEVVEPVAGKTVGSSSVRIDKQDEKT